MVFQIVVMLFLGVVGALVWVWGTGLFAFLADDSSDEEADSDVAGQEEEDC